MVYPKYSYDYSELLAELQEELQDGELSYNKVMSNQKNYILETNKLLALA